MAPPQSSSSPPSSSSGLSPFTALNFASLPIMAMREKIVEKIMENRVTLIVGETGCGKSSQVPLFLREANMVPVVCTQPRRFAVVAVARMVAKALQCEVGEEVGYHIGHSKVLSPSSKIAFKTAGVLLEEMREKGMNALKYKAIILDEVHERSVESDLVLVCIKQFLLKNKDIRLVLMSATADISRYRDYFKDLGRDERVEVLAIPSSNQLTNFQRRVLYLDQVVELLGEHSDTSDSLSLKYCCGTVPTMAKADIKLDVHKLIHELVLYLHKNEADIEKSILVFLPTYYSLEQQWFLLKPFSSCFKVHILHSSVDTEQALMAMKISKSHRKVILATNIAESSVTIPEVAYVIDTCRSLQVYWDGNRKRDTADLVWVSKSQADQRRGRTGRTCDGQVYRLVTRSFFDKLPPFESPAILKLSLRLQVLLICCAESKLINDPKVLLQKALDAPDVETVEDALNLLEHIKALEKTLPRGRYEPTFYGRLLASFSLSFDASLLILKFADAGMLREGILLGILMDMQPQPIIRPFGEENLFMEYTDSYYTTEGENSPQMGKKELVFLANLCAYQFWQRVFKDKIRLQCLKQLLSVEDVKVPQGLLLKIEEEWCTMHNVLQSSMHQISEIYNDILCSVHRYRPKFLGASSGLPSYYDPCEFKHICVVECRPNNETAALLVEDEQNESKKCLAVPYVSSHHFRIQKMAEKFTTVIKEIRVQHEEGLIEDTNQHAYGEAPTCVYYFQGYCRRGDDCLYSHSLQTSRPVCKFFATFQGCRNGDSCAFAHDLTSQVVSSQPSLCVPENEDVDGKELTKLFPISSRGSLLLLDDVDLHFSMAFSQHYDPSKIICTTSLSESCIYDTSLSGVKVLWEICHPLEVVTYKSVENPIPWSEVKCVFWFPRFDGDETSEKQKRLVQNFFEHFAARILADRLIGVHLILVMNNIRFSHLQVEKLAQDCLFFLMKSFPFDESTFGAVPDFVNTKKPGVVSTPISYVFSLHIPTNQFVGEFAPALSGSSTQQLVTSK
ncbi:DExH-box ATP-dependent RNA helicase DExH8-like [Silene latifolia]|uniref:DExH-box ATP-dependent RNA helicase DExH8-like n=1 Tax=Silene latifolia TaxID=37657 RepID=UPI003D786ECE